jgi:diacylglycerol kinase family enzyme
MNKVKRFIRNLEDHKEKTTANLKYSIDRFDILIISISSGGLVFSMGFIKDIIPKTPSINFLLLKISWMFFGLAIVLNLLSQVTGYYANNFELKITKNLIRQERKKAMMGNQTSFECKKRIMNFITNLFNVLSLFLLIGGIILFVIFMSKTF